MAVAELHTLCHTHHAHCKAVQHESRLLQDESAKSHRLLTERLQECELQRQREREHQKSLISALVAHVVVCQRSCQHLVAGQIDKTERRGEAEGQVEEKRAERQVVQEKERARALTTAETVEVQGRAHAITLRSLGLQLAHTQGACKEAVAGKEALQQQVRALAHTLASDWHLLAAQVKEMAEAAAEREKRMRVVQEEASEALVARLAQADEAVEESSRQLDCITNQHHMCLQQLETSSLDLARAHTVIKGHEAQQMHISCRVQEMLEHISQALAWCDRVSLDSQLAYHSHSQALRQVVVCEQDRISNSLEQQDRISNSLFLLTHYHLPHIQLSPVKDCKLRFRESNRCAQAARLAVRAATGGR
mmetsp:Transcript_95515/g.139492  ORF Transcript_95515/g.139492 Transcript_95515/m.139492 type:complete len:364 (-) Transcript_95515:840-1931(-)